MPGVSFARKLDSFDKKAFILLPGQATAVYTTGGLDHYRHSDWLGSARLTSTPSRTVSSTVAYAPLGETYAQSGTADLSFTGMNQDTTSGDYDFPARYYSTQGRWPSPDPAGLAAVDPSNPQSWNRYSYVLNNPLIFTDPNGLDCAYLNDSGTAADSIDHNSNIDECEKNGGYWANGTINQLSWVQPNVENDSAVIYSQFDNGGIGVSLATQNWTQGAFGLSDDATQSITSFQEWTDPTYDRLAMLAIYDKFNYFPNICSYTVTAMAGAPAGRMRVGAEYNTSKGFASRGRAQGGIGPVRGRVTKNSNGDVSTSVRVGGTYGVTVGFNGKGITSVGASVNVTKYLSVGASAQLANFYECPSK